MKPNGHDMKNVDQTEGQEYDNPMKTGSTQ